MTVVVIEDKGMNTGKLLGTRHSNTSHRGVIATDQSGAGSALQTMTHPLQTSSLAVNGMRPS